MLKNVCDEGRGVAKSGLAVYLDFADAIKRDGRDTIEGRYGNLFDMYQQITGENPYETPMMIYPAVHYTMGGLWVDYNLMTTVPGLYAIGEANFSDHGANRLGASALMQGLADGYFVIPYTIGDYLAKMPYDKLSTDDEVFKTAENEVKERINTLLNIKGSKTVDDFHKALGLIMWEYCGMSRNEEGLKKAKGEIKKLKEEFWKDVNVIGSNEELNQSLEKANRVADLLELGELMVDDALDRAESCAVVTSGKNHRQKKAKPRRIDDQYSYVSAWEFKGDGQ